MLYPSFRSRSHCEKSRKYLLLRSPWLSAARRQIRSKKRAREKRAERTLLRRRFQFSNYPVFTPLLFLKFLYVFGFLMKWTDELRAVLEVMFQEHSLRRADYNCLPQRKKPIDFVRNDEKRKEKKNCHFRFLTITIRQEMRSLNIEL